MDKIDAVLYLNLAHRTDRDAHLREELAYAQIPSEKIHRIDAIRQANGALGCGLSHIKAMETILEHPEWKRVLVLEDDFTFKREGQMDHAQMEWLLNELVSHESDTVDMCLLSYNQNFFRTEAVDNKPWIGRVLYSQTTSSYLISQHYVPVLLQNLRDATTDMILHGRRHENCIDIHWTTLQPSGRWFAVIPAIGYQYANYSDIEGGVTAYGC